VITVLDDLTTLAPRRLVRRLNQLAQEALPCHAATLFSGSEGAGLTVALHVDSRRRRDVIDLARVVDDDPRAHGSCDWSLLPPTRWRGHWRLLLRVSFERPVQCLFTVSFDIRRHANDPLRPSLPLLLAASQLVFVFDRGLADQWPLVWIGAPAAREPLLELLNAVGV
jgi:hypothetical protein